MPRPAEKPFHRRAHQHDSRVGSEQHQTILQICHDLLDVLFQGGEDLIGISYLTAEVGNLQRDHTVLVAAGVFLGNGLRFSGGSSVKTAGDLFQRSECDVRQSCRPDQRKQDGNAREHDRMLQTRR